MLKKIIFLSLLSLTSFLANSANLIDGEILYKESCIRCHEDNITENNFVVNIKELKDKISGCVYHLQLPWNDTDIGDTAAYLDKKYFFFDEEGIDFID
jgi:hypothetical protein